MLDQTSKVGCACVIAAGTWEPCEAHDAELAALEATGGVQMERVPLADAGFSLIRMSGAHTRESGAWHVTDSHLTITPRHKAPDKATRTVTLKTAIDSTMPRDRDCVTGEPYARFPRLEDVMIAEAVSEAHEARAAERAATMTASHLNEATTRRAREARKATRKVTGMRARPTVHNESHVVRQDMDAERMLRLSRALAIGSDSWADRQG